MPEINGLMLAEQLKRRYPDAAIIFLTAFPQYAVQAFKLRATGYLLKPVSLEDLKEEVDYALSRGQVRPSGHIVVQTFGNFEILVDGETLVFHRSKAKELLAYLVDRKGALCTNGEIMAILFEDDNGHEAYFRSLRKDLTDILETAGCGGILSQQRGRIGIVPEQVDCDYFNWCSGKRTGGNAFHGEYMTQYSWGEYTNAMLINQK
jgi:two-component SAPR family response regulator